MKTRILTFGIASLLLAALAVADTWDNSSGNQQWFTATNWLDNTEPTINDDVIFNEGFPGSGNALMSGEVARSLTFNASFTLRNALIIGTPTLTLGDGDITVASGKSASIQTNLISSALLEKRGAGALTLSVPVTFTGQSGLSIRQGTLTLASGASVTSDFALMGLDGFTTVNVTGAGALWSIPDGLDMGVNTNGSSTLNITAGGAVTLGDHIGGGNTVANTTLTLDGGTLDMQGHRIGNFGNVAASIDMLDFRSGTLKSVAEINNGFVPLIKTTSGTLILDGTNSYTGGTTISDGTLQIGNGSTTGSIIGNVTNAGTLAFNRSDDIVFPGVISGTGALLKLGSNQLTLTGMNTYAGITTVSAGTLVLNTSLPSGAAIDLASGAALHLGSSFSSAPRPVTLRGLPGSLFFIALRKFGTNAASLGGQLTIADNPNITVDAGGKLTLSGGITDNGGNSRFSLFGSGELVVSGPGTFSGGVTVIGGQLTVAHNSALGTGQVFVAELSSGTALAFADGVTFSNPLILRGVTLRALGDSTVTSNITLDGFVGSNINLNVPDAAHALTLEGDIAHTGASGHSVTKTGAGTLDILGTVGAGDIAFNANAGTTNIGEDQTLAALNIGSGALVRLGMPAPAPPFTTVPEPGVGALLLSALGYLGMRRGRVRGARASRVLVSASRRNELPDAPDEGNVHAFQAVREVREGRTPSPTLGTSVFPGTRCHAPSR